MEEDRTYNHHVEALIEAARLGDTITIAHLLDNHLVNVNGGRDGSSNHNHNYYWRALYCVPARRLFEAARSLLGYGADFSMRDDRDRWAPLHYTCWFGDLEATRLLQQHGIVCLASVDIKV